MQIIPQNGGTICLRRRSRISRSTGKREHMSAKRDMADFEIKDYRELTRAQRIALIGLVEKRMEIDLKNYIWPGEGYRALCMLEGGKPIATVEYSFQNDMFRVGDIVSE